MMDNVRYSDITGEWRSVNADRSRMHARTARMQPWSEFLRELSNKLFDEADEIQLEILAEREPERIASRGLGFPGASPAAIAAREQTLKVTLPDDYRAFLLASNGFLPLAGLPHGLCSLLPVEEIDWFRIKDRETGRLENYLEERAAGAELPEEFTLDPNDYVRTLLIGESDGNECILMLPPGPNNADWELWTYHPEEGFVTGGTFTELMESALEA
jgi:cell wall assembly regulator SMI1